jgi:receptor protein-tyrosine kinase
VDLRAILAALRGGWWLPFIGMVLAGGIVLALSLAQTPLYTSSTQLFVSTTDSASTSDAYQGSQLSQQRVSSYTRLITGEELAARVVERMDLPLAPAMLSDRITATSAIDTVLIDVTVADPSPERAQRIAEVVCSEFIDLVEELESPSSGGESPVTVTVSDRPDVPGGASSPQTTRNVGLGLVVGLVVGAGLSVLRASLDRSVKEPEDVVSATGAAVIGTVLRDDALKKRRAIDWDRDRPAAESYRQLRTNLQYLSVDQPPSVIMISSALPSEGKTTTVVNLGLALADSGRRVTIVEADLRKPNAVRYLGLVEGAGVTDILAGKSDIDDVLQAHGDGMLSVIAAGRTPPNPGELLGSSHMAELLEKLRATNDFVLIDSPPLLPVADSSGLAVHTDGVLLSVRYGSTRRDQLQQAAATLDRVGVRTLGVILNVVPPNAELAAAYGAGYGYEADAPIKDGKRRVWTRS